MQARSRDCPAAHAQHAGRAQPFTPPTVAVLGAGSWGTALAAAARRAGLPVRLWSRRPDVAHAIRTTGCNPRHLPGIELPGGLQVGDDLHQMLQGADVVVFAVPCAALRELGRAAARSLPAHSLVLAACKGVEPDSGELMTDVLRACCAPRQPVGMLAGPSFADEVARGLPARLTLGSADLQRVAGLTRLLAPALRKAGIELDLCDDEVGVQVAGALKNVVAIACGMASAQGLGENARAALVARGLEDMRALTLALGGRSETLFLGCGVGDLFLTAASSHSRNTRLGLRLGAAAQQRTTDDGAGSGELAEGAVASHALALLEQRLQLRLRVPAAVRDVLQGRRQAAQALRDVLGAERPAAAVQPVPACAGGQSHGTAHSAPRAAPSAPPHDPLAALRVSAGAAARRVVQ